MGVVCDRVPAQKIRWHIGCDLSLARVTEKRFGTPGYPIQEEYESWSSHRRVSP